MALSPGAAEVKLAAAGARDVAEADEEDIMLKGGQRLSGDTIIISFRGPAPGGAGGEGGGGRQGGG